MNVTKTLDRLMKERGIRGKADLARQAGIPYTTIAGMYAKGADNMKLGTLRKLSAFFGVTIDELVSSDAERM